MPAKKAIAKAKISKITYIVRGIVSELGPINGANINIKISPSQDFACTYENTLYLILAVKNDGKLNKDAVIIEQSQDFSANKDLLPLLIESYRGAYAEFGIVKDTVKYTIKSIILL